MADTYRHQWQYRWKQYWKSKRHKWHNPIVKEVLLNPEVNYKFDEVMNRLLENYAEVTYYLDEPKDRTFNPPEYYDYMWKMGTRKKWIKKVLWHNHRSTWKQKLKEGDWEALEVIPRRPERYEWKLW